MTLSTCTDVGDGHGFDEDRSRLPVGIVVAERAKVVNAGECRGRPGHAIDIKRLLDPPGKWFRERRTTT
jgi:hypothetical protein